ncbi:MAG: S46 family peptidase, partial [Bacteroidales bacterium]|nr:S46 family peptidase [Bacteroidales bacterium]
IYADKENKPADFSKANVPYKPAYHFPISIKGVNEGDFTMVFGYPGSTSEYVTSFHIDMIKNYFNPKMIDLRTKKIEILEYEMNSDQLIRIQYSAKKAGIANTWKRWIGESQGLEKMKTIDKKKEFENRLTVWINENNDRITKYGDILPKYKELYSELKDYSIVSSYSNEVFIRNGIEAISLARRINALVKLFENNGDPDKIQTLKLSLIEIGKNFFKNYNMETDKKLFVTLMTMYGENLETKWQAPEYIKIKNSCKGNFSSVADKYYEYSVFSDEARFNAFIKGFNKSDIHKLNKDPFYLLAINVTDFLAEKVKPELDRINDEIKYLNKNYMTAQMEFDKERVFYPDANSTLRITYGTVKGYFSKDAVYFTHYTTLKGIMEKDNPDIYDYDVPDKLRELYSARDFGRYTQNGEVPVCFIANNHTTGGNSGSPVINGDGNLIGVNFDRAWEGVASDLAFNPDQSRNISLDIRYALFIIDKFAGAGYLLNEMTIVE